MPHVRPISIEPHILIYAFRYALGRDSFAVNDVAQIILRDKDKIPINLKRVIIVEIESAIKKDEAGGAGAVSRWRTVRQVLLNGNKDDD